MASAHFVDPAYDVAGFLYSAVIASGGVMGFIKKGSMASLVAGGGSGLAAAYGAYCVTKNPRDVKVSLVVTLILTLLMGSRFARSGKFMPAGLVTILSLIMLIRYALRLQLLSDKHGADPPRLHLPEMKRAPADDASLPPPSGKQYCSQCQAKIHSPPLTPLGSPTNPQLVLDAASEPPERNMPFGTPPARSTATSTTLPLRSRASVSASPTKNASATSSPLKLERVASHGEPGYAIQRATALASSYRTLEAELAETKRQLVRANARVVELEGQEAELLAQMG